MWWRSRRAACSPRSERETATYLCCKRLKANLGQQGDQLHESRLIHPLLKLWWEKISLVEMLLCARGDHHCLGVMAWLDEVVIFCRNRCGRLQRLEDT